MKKLITLIICLVAFMSNAQTLSEFKKKEALQTATSFCNLFERYCNGERTLSAQINALCTGNDCSAYDDVKTLQETALRNYLLTIQRYYPKKLATSVSAPSLEKSEIFIVPEIDLSTKIGAPNGSSSALSVTQIADLNVTNVKNIYVVFDIAQSFPTLNLSKHKKLIYDVKSKKIAAYILDGGTFLCYCKGLTCFADKDYKKALYYFDKGTKTSSAQQGRQSLTHNCLGMAYVSALYSLDMETALKYAKKMNDPVLEYAMEMCSAIDKKDSTSVWHYASLLENNLDKLNDSFFDPANVYLLLGSAYGSSITPQDIRKAIDYLRKADDLGNIQAGYILWEETAIWVSSDDAAIQNAINTTTGELVKRLHNSADRGFYPAYFVLGRIDEDPELGNNSEEAKKWYHKSAQTGNVVAMACLGKMYAEEGNNAEATKWLKLSLTGNKLEAQLEIDKEDLWYLSKLFPQSRADVEGLLRKVNGSSSYSTGSTSAAYSHSSTSSQTHSSTISPTSSSHSSYSSSSNYNTYHSHSEFNAPKDNYYGGFSIGYIQKEWAYSAEDGKTNLGLFDDDKYINGIQAGIRCLPRFKYGFGLSTGLYYEYYFSKSDEYHEDALSYHMTYNEHSLYLPVHLRYSLNFSKWFQLTFYGGIGLDLGLSGKVSVKSDGEEIENLSIYNEDFDTKRFNTSLEYGSSIRVNHVQVDFSICKGLINMCSTDDLKCKINKRLNISLSYIF